MNSWIKNPNQIVEKHNGFWLGSLRSLHFVACVCSLSAMQYDLWLAGFQTQNQFFVCYVSPKSSQALEWCERVPFLLNPYPVWRVPYINRGTWLGVWTTPDPIVYNCMTDLSCASYYNLVVYASLYSTSIMNPYGMYIQYIYIYLHAHTHIYIYTYVHVSSGTCSAEDGEQQVWILGDCWLVSSFSALAEYPDRVRSLFKQHELSEVCVLVVCRWFGADFPFHRSCIAKLWLILTRCSGDSTKLSSLRGDCFRWTQRVAQWFGMPYHPIDVGSRH